MDGISIMRTLVVDALDKCLFRSAALISENICREDSATIADRITLAKCYHRAGEPRRCLASLENNGFLSAASMEALRKIYQEYTHSETNEHTTLKQFGKDQLVSRTEALYVAARCLFETDQYDSCISLLQPLILLGEDDEDQHRMIEYSAGLISEATKTSASNKCELNLIACVYCLVGECYEKLDNRVRSIRAFKTALRIDKLCVEAISYLSERGLLTSNEKCELYEELSPICEHRHWINTHLRISLMQQDPSLFYGRGEGDGGSENTPALNSPTCLIQQASYCFDQQNYQDAYRLVRHAYTLDPHDPKGLAIYIASMTELRLKTELFYLGHDLVNSNVKDKLSWYCVGCYYWCCTKNELAQKYLLKATKSDKRFSEAWLLLGHVLSCQEESEQAIAAYRTAARLMPGDHRPLVCMAKELLRTNVLPLARHVLLGALEMCPGDAGLLNELGVISLKSGNINDALVYLEQAVQILSTQNETASVDLRPQSQRNNQVNQQFTFKKSCGTEIFANYATALRRCGHYEDALFWYDKCLSAGPSDSNIHASIGFTYHIMQRFDRAIVYYHQALAIKPKFTFCSDMLNHAMEDISTFPLVQCDLSSSESDMLLETDNSSCVYGADEADAEPEQSVDLSAVDSFSHIAWRLSIGST